MRGLRVGGLKRSGRPRRERFSLAGLAAVIFFQTVGNDADKPVDL